MKLFPVFDTDLAARKLWTKSGFQFVVKKLLDIDAEKDSQRSNWIGRYLKYFHLKIIFSPLSEQQKLYARNDVRLMAKFYPIIIKELEKKGFLSNVEYESRQIFRKTMNNLGYPG